VRSRPSIFSALTGAACIVFAASAGAAAAAVSLDAPVHGSSTNDATPVYSGSAADGSSDAGVVAVRVYIGPAVAGDPLQTVSAVRTGALWSVEGSTPLADGIYTAQAEQADGIGSTQLSAPVTFSIDTIRPDTKMESGPVGPTNDATPEFTFTSPDASGFLCRLSSPRQVTAAGFTACSSPRGSAALDDASYVFEVAAVDAAGNEDETPATRAFRVDTTAPRTTITGGPGDTTASGAAFLFSSNEVAALSCRLDGGAWRPCSSPQSYSRLALGPHEFEVRAVDRAGNQGAAARHAWHVLKPGIRIPGAGAQAVALAQDLVELRDALKRTRLRPLARRKEIRLAGFDALTAGRVELRARARPRHRPRGVSFAVARRDVPAAGRYALQAKLTRQGRRLARRQAKLPIQLRLAFTDLAGRSLWAIATTTMRR
jgi:hypothetical protein